MLDAFAGQIPAAEVDPELDQLTPREREVLRLIARNYLYKEIARRLQISAKTVEAHVGAVLRKLQLSSRHELSRWAVERNWWTEGNPRTHLRVHPGADDLRRRLEAKALRHLWQPVVRAMLHELRRGALADR